MWSGSKSGSKHETASQHVKCVPCLLPSSFAMPLPSPSFLHCASSSSSPLPSSCLFPPPSLPPSFAIPLSQVLVTNTVMHDIHEKRCGKIKTIDISIMLAEAIRRIYHGESMSQLFRNIPMED